MNNNIKDFLQRNYPMSDNDYREIIKLADKLCSISLDNTKKEMVYTRFARRLRELNISNFKKYIDYIKDNQYLESRIFVNLLTTNVTSFFREKHHFDYLEKYLASDNLPRNIKILSAGCSSGEEPYSIAMLVDRVIKKKPNLSIDITATDINTSVLEHAKAGEYSAEKINDLPNHYEKLFFYPKKAGNNNKSSYLIKDEIKKYINFRQINLLGNWQLDEEFNIIFCRNVMIYFNRDTKKILLEKFANVLPNQGLLFLGHSENTNNLSDRFKFLNKTTYIKEK